MNTWALRTSLSVLMVLAAGAALPATRTWTGGGSGAPFLEPANWTVAANWNGAAPVPGDDLVFPDHAANSTSSNNDFPPGTLFNSISATGFYRLAGNSINVGAGGLESGQLLYLRIPVLSGETRVKSGAWLTVETGSIAGPVTVTNGRLFLGNGVSVGPVSLSANSFLILAGEGLGAFPPERHATAASLTLDSTSTLNISLPPDALFQLTVSGPISLGNAQLGHVIPEFEVYPAGTQIRIIDNVGAGAISGTFAGLPEGATLEEPGRAQKFSISYAGGTGNDVVLTALPAATSATALTISPNPSSVGQKITLTATVATSSGKPEGLVSFDCVYCDGTWDVGIGSAPLNDSGVATFTFSSSTIEQRAIRAQWNGTATIIGSQSPDVLQNVVAAVPALDIGALALLAIVLMVVAAARL